MTADLHAERVVIDAVCPLAASDPRYLDWYRQGGVTALGPTAGGTESARAAFDSLAGWHRLLRERDDLLLVRSASDVQLAKRSNRLGVFLHFQGTDPIEDNLDLVDAYKSLGVGIVQLTYNVRNRVGDGCEERSDAGLSAFGVKVVERLNCARIIVDCSHTGTRTTLDAIERSSAPVILSHSNAAAIHPCPRNVGYDVIDAIAKSGGVVGIAGFPGMVSAAASNTLDDFIAHVDAIVERVGSDHVGLGIDYYSLQAGVASEAEAQRGYESFVRSGLWGASYPPPPHRYPAGIETPRTLRRLTQRLGERGYSSTDIGKVLGGNWMRVMRAVWG